MNVAFIPVRGGSKSIPLKNIKEINGKPLVYWVVKAASECSDIDVIYVATDSDLIKNTVEKFCIEKVRVIGRSAESACDTASTESAMLEFAEKNEFDNIVLIQATSPMLKGCDLDGGFRLFKKEDCDSVISVVRQYRFIWETDKNGFVSPKNYDVYNRPRRQDFDGYLMENGAFYITSREALLKTRNRVSGNIMAYEMPEETAFEIDEPSDWIIIEELMKKAEINNPYDFSEVRMFLTDCDGCLTDGGMYYSENGDELKKFNTRDGMAFAMLRKLGILTGIVTGENVELNRRRVEKLGLDIYVPGCSDKESAVQKICEEYGISLRNVVYVGDDINDIEVIKNVGFGCCPNNAVEQIKKVAGYVASSKGGEGVIREIVDAFFGNELRRINEEKL